MPRDKIGHFYYSWYPTIYQADTQHLTLAEDGAYRRLIDHYMTIRAPLLDEDRALARIIGIGLDEWEPIKNLVKTYFKPSVNPPGYLTHNFCDEIIAKDTSRIVKSKANGARGGRPSTKGKAKEITQPVTEVKPLTTLHYTEQSKKKEAKASFVKFENFWTEYPTLNRMKGSRKKASTAFEVALKKTDCETIMQGVKKYAAYLTNSGQSNADAFRWLQDERWGDDYAYATGINGAAGNPNKDDRARAAIMRGLAGEPGRAEGAGG